VKLFPFSPLNLPPDPILFLRHPRSILIAAAVALAVVAMWLLFAPRRRTACVIRLGGLVWKRSQFCRGWLITGDTGSGKTSSGINQLAHQVFRNEAHWGGRCVDEKGVYWETLAAMARHYGREADLIHLQIRPDDTDPDWTPRHRYNLTGDRSIPFSTYAKFVVDTATSLGQGGDKGFFKSQAQTHIAYGLELIFELRRPVKRSSGYSAGKRNVNYSETEKHKLKPHKLRGLRDHECVLIHCERGFRRVTLPPLEPDGTVAKWFSSRRAIR